MSQIKGVVKKWVIEKGFGFIQATDGSGDMFVHYRQIQGGRTTLNVGENVTYTTGTDAITGKIVAENVVGDGTGTPAPEGAGRGGRGGFAGRGGRSACFAYQRGACRFGESCRFLHQATGAVVGSGAGFGGAWGGQGRGAVAQLSEGYGQGVIGGAAPQARYGPYGGVQPQGYSPQPAVGVYGQQAVGASMQQVPGVGAYGQQPAAGSYNPQQGGQQSNSYVQQGVQGYPQQQPVAAAGYNQQGVASNMYSQKPVGVGTYGEHPGMSGVNAYEPSAANSYSSRGAYGQQGVGGGAPAAPARGGYQQF